MGSLRSKFCRLDVASRAYLQATQVLGFLGCIFIGGCAVSSAANLDCSQKSKNEISLEDDDHHIYTDVDIAGKFKEGTDLREMTGLKMMIDTGSSDNYLPSALKYYAKIETHSVPIPTFTVLGYESRMVERYIGDAYIGEKGYNNVAFSIAEPSKNNKSNSGLMGTQTLFYNDIFELNVPKKKIVLYYPRNCWVESTMENNYHEIKAEPVKFRDSSIITLPVKVEGVDANAIFDTGADLTYIDASFIKKMGMTEEDFIADEKQAIEADGGQVVPVYKHKFKEITIANVIFKDVDAYVGSFSIPSGAQMGLGLNLWRNVGMRYDPQSNKTVLSVSGFQTED